MLLFHLIACSLLDRSAPALSAEGSQATPNLLSIRVRTQDEHPVDVAVLDASGVVIAQLPSAPSDSTIEVRGLPDGAQTLTITAIDASLWAHTATVPLDVVFDAEAPVLTAAPLLGGQGRTAVLWVTSNEPLQDAVLTVFDHELPLFPVEDRYRAIVGIPLEQAPGTATGSLSARDAVGHITTQPIDVTVSKVDYPIGGYIKLSKTQQKARSDDEGRAKMRAERDGAYALLRPKLLFQVPLQKPAEGRFTSPFGKYREYSDGARRHHTGIDIGNAAGTPVLAAATGEVVVATEQVIFGNAVILHHGQGVTTSYNHLESIDCKEGDILEAGDRVGRLGSTGQSTGPHLHFSMVVGEEAVDPAQWLDGDVSLTP